MSFISKGLPQNIEHGAILVDGVQIGSLHRCCHCGMIFEIVSRRYKMDDRKTKFTQCLACSDGVRIAFTCGSEKCVKFHVPFEKKLDMIEKGSVILG